VTAAELAAFVAQARVEVDETLARYESLDLAALPPHLRANAEAMLAALPRAPGVA